MRQHDLISIFCKTFGLYFLIQAVINIRDVFFYVVGTQVVNGDDEYFFFTLLMQLSYLFFNLVAGWYLLTRSNFIASKIVKSSDTSIELGVTKSDLIELVVIGIGLFLTVQAVPQVLSKIVNYVYFNPFDRNQKDEFWVNNNNRGELIFALFKLAVGLVALTNARLLSRRLMQAGDKSDRIDHEGN